jgi:hypothetical protein
MSAISSVRIRKPASPCTCRRPAGGPRRSLLRWRVRARTRQQVRHQVAGFVGGGGAQLAERLLDRGALAASAHGLDAGDLLALQGGIDAQDLQLGVVALAVVVDADDDPLAAVDLALQRIRRVGDLTLREPRLDRLDHAAELVDLAEVLVGLGLQLVGERLHEIRAPERIDRVRDPGLVRDHLLRT